MAVCRGSDDPERYALGVHDHGAFDAPLPAVHRASARLLATAGGLGDAAVDGHLGEFEADDPIVRSERHLFEQVHRAGLYPLVAPPPQRGRRTRLVGDPLVSATEHQDLHELLEDHPIRYARPVAAEGVIGLSSRQQRRELLPDGLDDVWWDRGHGRVPSLGSFDNSPDDGTSRARFSCGTDPYWRKLLVQRTAEHFQVEEVSADKAYLSHKNLKAVELAGGMPFVPFKSNTVEPTEAGTWAKMYHLFMHGRDAFLEHYHQRSNIESAYSMIKGKFGSHLRSKSDAGQVNECLCKVLCHNVCVLIQEMHELGIEPAF